jgi:hypothetical protein
MNHVSNSLRRGAPRVALLIAASIACIVFAKTPVLLGWTGSLMALLAPLSFGFGMVLNGLAAGDIAMRILQPMVDSQHLALSAERNRDPGSGMAYLGHCVLRAVILMLMVTAARAEAPPAAAAALLPVLQAEQRVQWPAMPMASALGAQVEQETCIRLTHPKCWSPRAELHTSREQGIGLGQLTRAFRADGSTRFDALAEVRAAHPKELGALTWEAPYDARLQLRALVLKDRDNYQAIRDAATVLDRLAFAFSAYNGGMGGVRQDRIACEATPDCDSGRWFANVEKTSLKAQAAVPGYGQSFFAINRSYVRNILIVRRVRYGVLDA